MANVLLYGLLSVSPLILGAWLGSIFNIRVKIIGVITAFGAGTLLAALTFGLMEESFQLGGLDNSILGFVLGGLLFALGEILIIRIGGRGHRRSHNVESTTGWGIVLGAVLDGIPESIALGMGFLLNKKIGLMLLLAIILSNLPEAISSAYDLKKIGKSLKTIILTWTLVALAGFIFVLLGYLIFVNISPDIVATFQSLAAGGLLAMIATTMMPEAFKESGIDSSLATVFGFLTIFILSKLGL